MKYSYGINAEKNSKHNFYLGKGKLACQSMLFGVKLVDYLRVKEGKWKSIYFIYRDEDTDCGEDNKKYFFVRERKKSNFSRFCWRDQKESIWKEIALELVLEY